MKYSWATATHVGHVRDGNEDAVFPLTDGVGPGPVVVAVADGMGGHVAGEVASRVAIDAATSAPPHEADVSDRVHAGNRAVIDAILGDPRLSGMGTTLTIALFDEDGTLHLGHVGDSRAYLFRDGEIRQLTTDHTLVTEMAAKGQISPDEIETHPQRHLLTRVLGMNGLHPDVHDMIVIGGDRILLCSDGLSGMVNDATIATTLLEARTPSDAVWALIDAANASGGVDNITAAVVDVSA